MKEQNVNLKIKEKGDNYEMYEDGSFNVECKCGQIDFHEPDSKLAIRANQIPGTLDNYQCLRCWKKGKQEETNSKEDRIRYAQSWNLAVAITSPIVNDLIKKSDKNNSQEIHKLITSWMEEWQQYFYGKLKREE